MWIGPVIGCVKGLKIAEDFSIWCAVSIAGNAAATVGLLTCVETAVWVAKRL